MLDLGISTTGDGRVTVRGATRSDAETEQIRRALSATPGVEDVDLELHAVSGDSPGNTMSRNTMSGG
ncbi:hypothetical protein [Rhodococcoides corynebacterioides]|uniref:hypothetical protein n=1 Tax=Rhodococcoides corynebacterioides TaxID=53972 RepID=UPI00083451AE|nr:hypothetical protein [Rhodococcus corynebacterioides]